MGSRCGRTDIASRAAARRGCRAEAQRALQHELARLVPGGRPETLTLGEWVEEYLEMHQGERVWDDRDIGAEPNDVCATALEGARI
jgi:hypothetical protein